MQNIFAPLHILKKVEKGIYISENLWYSKMGLDGDAVQACEINTYSVL